MGSISVLYKPTDAASQLTVKWGCSRRTSLRDLEIAQSELANALDSVKVADVGLVGNAVSPPGGQG